VQLTPLHRLPAREAEARVGELGDGADVALSRELGEGTGEQVVTRRAGGAGAVRRPGGRLAAPYLGAVDEIVVHEGRHVDELDRHAGRDWRGRTRRRAEEREQRPQALAAGRERINADRGHPAPM
jgi:hypothetical protein